MITSSSDTLRIVIVDDEPLARQRLRDLLADAPGVSIIAECRNGASALETIASMRPDVVLLDIEMPGRDGMSVAEFLRGLGEEAPVFVFVTGHAEHALRAFDIRAADYLLKPYDGARLFAALDRARELLTAKQINHLTMLRRAVRAELRELAAAEPAPGGTTSSDRFAVTVGRRTVFVRAESLDRVLAEGNYVRLCAGRESYLLRATMQEMERRLDPRAFVRIHRSVIVRIGEVREMRTSQSGEAVAVMSDGTELPVSPRYRRRLESTG